MKYRFYKSQKIKAGDILHIPFGPIGTDASRFEVLEANKRKSFLKVRVIQDLYEVDPFLKDSVIDIGKSIYQGFWCFVRESV